MAGIKLKSSNLKKYIYFGLFISIALTSCSKDGGSTDPCNGLSFKFSTDVQPIINATCATSASCHASGSVNSGGPLTDHSKISIKQAEIKFQVETGQMPKNSLLTADQKNKIICWINSGAPNN